LNVCTVFADGISYIDRNAYIAYKGTALLSLSCMSELELLPYSELHYFI